MPHTRTITAFLISGIVTAIFIAAITIGGELAPAFKDWLKLTFYHHWLGKGALSIILFIALGIALSFVSTDRDSALASSARALTWVSILSALVILGFFSAEAFHLF
ncbi:MAG TPA: hypothetical protein VJH69_00350 [Candidatus Paceibacterota bacterium]